MVYELERMLPVCNGFLCSMSVTYAISNICNMRNVYCQVHFSEEIIELSLTHNQVLSASPTKFEMVQRRCSRYVTGNFDRTSSVTSLLNCLSWPTLEKTRRQYRLAVMYRILHNQVDILWQSFLTKKSSCRRGHSC